MKYAAIASAVTVIAFTDALPTSLPTCNVTKLEPLLTFPNTTKCGTDSGYQVTSLTTPTNPQIQIMCNNAACVSVLSRLQMLAPTDCILGAFSLYKDLITPVTVHCNGNSLASAVTSTMGSTKSSSPINVAMTNSTDSTIGSIESKSSTVDSASSADSTDSTIGSTESKNSTVDSANSADSTDSKTYRSVPSPSPTTPKPSTTSSASTAAISAAAILIGLSAAIF